MKKLSKYFALGLCLGVFAVTTAGCGETDSDSDKKEDSGTETVSSDSANESESEDSATTVTLDEQVVYDGNGIKITATGLEDAMFGTDLKLLIENNTSQNITVHADNVNVNGYMVSTIMAVDVAAGKKVNDDITIETSGLKDCGIETIASIELNFRVSDSDTYSTIFSTEPIKIDTSAAASYTQTYDDSGNVLVDANGVRIISKGLSEDDSFWGPGQILYIENNTDTNITVQAKDVSINGFMVQSSMSEDVAAGKKALTAIQFFSSDLEDNGITEVTDLEFYFHIYNADNWDTIFDSDVINISDENHSE